MWSITTQTLVPDPTIALGCSTKGFKWHWQDRKYFRSKLQVGMEMAMRVQMHWHDGLRNTVDDFKVLVKVTETEQRILAAQDHEFDWMHETARCFGYPSDSTRAARERGRGAACGHRIRRPGPVRPARPQPPPFQPLALWLKSASRPCGSIWPASGFAH